MNNIEYRLVSHTLGVKDFETKLPKEYFRNYFQVGKGDNFNVFTNLKERGLVTMRSQFGQTVFYISDKGIKEFENMFKQKNN